MNRILAAGFFLVVGVEILAMLGRDHRFVLAASGVAMSLVLFALCWLVARGSLPGSTEAEVDDRGESLRRWMSRTEALVSWSECSRSDWDRHLRPMLARQFALATNQQMSKDPAAFQASGRMLFGHRLWAWVDPENVAYEAQTEPAPGRAVLDEILQRLVRL
jgi:hypothetical protein